MKTTTLSLHHERVDDIPLLLGFLQQLNFPELLERHLGSHHLHRGMSNGWLGGCPRNNATQFIYLHKVVRIVYV